MKTLKWSEKQKWCEVKTSSGVKWRESQRTRFEMKWNGDKSGLTRFEVKWKAEVMWCEEKDCSDDRYENTTESEVKHWSDVKRRLEVTWSEEKGMKGLAKKRSEDAEIKLK